MFSSLTGRSVIVTGASKGIGRGIALRFGAAGCQVLVVSLTLSEADGVAAEIVAAGRYCLSRWRLCRSSRSGGKNRPR
jgi:3-oxoacyl-[acyl-carrier protein] reductase